MLRTKKSVTAVIGTQWGDEGKGKIVDALSSKYNIIARAAGGANAGHTIYLNGEKHVFHLMPSGALHEGLDIVLGAGMVIHMPTLLEEIDLLEDGGIEVLSRLKISAKAHLVMEYHMQIDEWMEAQREKLTGKTIGTTKRGIGPAYADKAHRVGLRAETLKTPDIWEEKVQEAARRLKQLYDIDVDVSRELRQLKIAAERLASQVGNTEVYLAEQIAADKRVLIEGAQATLLDIDHGSYPYVTSSATTVAGALQGLGIAPSSLDYSIGVIKAYCTRVGNGDFPTELHNEAGERLRERGGEYGATTGRPRRCGWLDLALLKEVVQINGLDGLALTKLDILDEEKEILIGIDSNDDGSVQYKSFGGWMSDTSAVRSYNNLPLNAQNYVAFIEEYIGVPVRYIGVGQDRAALIDRS